MAIDETKTSCRLRIKESLATLSRKEKQVASYILQYADEIPRMSIEELARACNTSPSSVVRLCKTVGCSGYKELCRMLTADANHDRPVPEYTDVRPGVSLSAIANSVANSNQHAIDSTMRLLDWDSLEKAVDALCRCERVDFYGVGTSGLVAQDGFSKFIRIGKQAHACADSHMQILTAATLKKGDVAVIISYSGETRDSLILADTASRNGATVISITKYGKNSLQKLSHISLSTFSSESLVRSGAMSSRISQLTVIDILYTATASRNYRQVKQYLDSSRYVSGKIRGISSDF